MNTTITQIINVTAKHIVEGERRQACRCPVALAIGDQWDSHIQPVVLNSTICLGEHFTPMPPEVDRFVRDFDVGLPVEPFAFALDIPVNEEDL